MVKFSKRVKAYLIDFVILISVVTIISMILPQSQRLIDLNKDIEDLQNSLVENKIDNEEYIQKYSEILPEYDKENVLSNVCQLIFILGYFVVIPVINNGQTIGKKVVKIKVTKNDGKLTIIDMIIRSFIVTNIAQLIVSSIFVNLLSNNIYYQLLTNVDFFRILLVIISIFMILYRKDKKGVHDLITHTSVVEVEK